jgi:hypothetical protein
VNDLSALVYRSRATKPLSDIDLFYLLAQARQRNEETGLTGLLLYDRGWFFQWLEGPTAHLGRTWNRIRRDPRHGRVTVVADQPIPLRIYADWTMGFAHRDRQHGAVLNGFVTADVEMLEDLHLNPDKAPNILAAFNRMAGGSSSRS